MKNDLSQNTAYMIKHYIIEQHSEHKLQMFEDLDLREVKQVKMEDTTYYCCYYYYIMRNLPLLMHYLLS